jgi:hypothetical protein
LKKAVGKDFKGKISPVLYLIAIASTFFADWVALSIYALVALMWLVPDKRIENALAAAGVKDKESCRCRSNHFS